MEDDDKYPRPSKSPSKEHPFFKLLKCVKYGKRRPKKGERARSPGYTTQDEEDDQDDQTVRSVKDFDEIYSDEAIIDMDPALDFSSPTIKVKHVEEVEKEATIIKLGHNLNLVEKHDPGVSFTKECLESLPDVTQVDQGYAFGPSFMRGVYRHYLNRFFEGGCPRGNSCKVKDPRKVKLDRTRVVHDIRDAYLDDVIAKVEIFEDQPPNIHLRHLDEVNEMMVRLDNYLSVQNQASSTKAINFTQECLRSLQGTIPTDEGYVFTAFGRGKECKERMEEAYHQIFLMTLVEKWSIVTLN
ncbi:unnamed protein product [Cuscuta europaea]|uniref:Uncharacterized protein n=1 Tax=Cuscuta europaea TaxID=41803 RepID=A0A9P0ZTH4_CUSEU|nr:unnamed protein product [Cuscuta europaea]